jgi:hypothetical protein
MTLLAGFDTSKGKCGGILMPQKRDPKTGQFIPNGGAYIDEQGYPRISCGPCRGQRIHRVKVAIILGRELPANTDVHHVGEKTDIRDCNLQIMSHGAHSSLTAKLRWILKKQDEELKKQWEAYFDGETA